jgi:hypothetical protein
MAWLLIAIGQWLLGLDLTLSLSTQSVVSLDEDINQDTSEGNKTVGNRDVVLLINRCSCLGLTISVPKDYEPRHAPSDLTLLKENER